jgi:hypothetical protein
MESDLSTRLLGIFEAHVRENRAFQPHHRQAFGLSMWLDRKVTLEVSRHHKGEPYQ